jgi:hypothetical protein
VWLALPGLAFALLGGYLALVLLRLFLGAVRTARHGPITRGEIRSLRPHPRRSRRYSAAEARLADGRSLPVAVPTAPAAALLGRDGRAEVLLVAAPDLRHGYVIGIRAGPRARGEGAAGAFTPAE